MTNPYRSPSETPAKLPGSRAANFWLWFTALLLLMLFLNFLRPVLSWGVSDGYEQTGFPFVVFERGGFSYSESTNYLSIVPNSIIALAIAYFGAHFFRDGFYAAFRKFQTWGTEDAA